MDEHLLLGIWLRSMGIVWILVGLCDFGLVVLLMMCVCVFAAPTDPSYKVRRHSRTGAAIGYIDSHSKRNHPELLHACHADHCYHHNSRNQERLWYGPIVYSHQS